MGHMCLQMCTFKLYHHSHIIFSVDTEQCVCVTTLCSYTVTILKLRELRS